MSPLIPSSVDYQGARCCAVMFFFTLALAIVQPRLPRRGASEVEP